MASIRTRYAPSPTGYLHVGGLRTALYAYLFAKQQGGTFILRIEDTDRERFVADGTQNILQSLYWGGVVPDEGVVLGDVGEIIHQGAFGPYIQSERLPIYQTHVNQLLASGHAYRCFCTPERLDEVRKRRQEEKLPPGYDGTCRDLSAEEVAARLAAGEGSVVRLRMPDEGSISFHDQVRGTVTFQYADVDDQIIMKSDGYPTYHMAVVVDDHLMEITHVIRGEEWISSTPKHLYLYEAFGWQAPEFAHLPLLLNPDKSKLSKRQGDVAVLDYRDKGYLPEALVNFVAFLGWNPGTEQEIFSMEELLAQFSLENVQKAGAVFNQDKLLWFNRQHLLRLDEKDFLARIQSFLEPSYHALLTPAVVGVIRERIHVLNEVFEIFKTDLAFVLNAPELDVAKISWKDSGNEETITALKAAHGAVAGLSEYPSADEVKAVLWPLAEAAAGGRGSILWPVRYGLTGQQASPDPFIVISILGRDASLARLTNTIVCLGGAL